MTDPQNSRKRRGRRPRKNYTKLVKDMVAEVKRICKPTIRGKYLNGPRQKVTDRLIARLMKREILRMWRRANKKLARQGRLRKRPRKLLSRRPRPAQLNLGF
jgi:hypothetical protein